MKAEARDGEMEDGDHAMPANAAEHANEDEADAPAEQSGLHGEVEAVDANEDHGTAPSTAAEMTAPNDANGTAVLRGVEPDHEENDDHVMEGEEDTVIY